MARLRIVLDRFGGRTRTASVAVVILAVALFLVDFVVLRGDLVAYDTIAFDSSEPGLLGIGRVGVEHLVEITTRRRVAGESRGRALNWRLMDPDGHVVHQGTELTSRKQRFFHFTPPTAGEYSLYIEDNALVFGSARGSARVEIYVNDRRILGRLFAAF